MRLLIIGGDARNQHLAELAVARGHSVQLLGHDEHTLAGAEPCETVVLPFPVAEIDGYAPTPLPKQRLPMQDVCALIMPRAKVYATKPGPVITQYIREHSCIRIDFMEDEAFAVRNAIPSAEGSIHSLMGRSTACIDGSRCLVAGYGRIGRMTAIRLRALGAEVTVAARSPAARAHAQSDGCRAIPLEQMTEAADYRYLVNTVPYPIISRDVLRRMPAKLLALDLASPPYGIDLEAAKELGIEAWREPGLPGRYAPETAAAAMLALIEEKDGV